MAAQIGVWEVLFEVYRFRTKDKAKGKWFIVPSEVNRNSFSLSCPCASAPQWEYIMWSRSAEMWLHEACRWKLSFVRPSAVTPSLVPPGLMHIWACHIHTHTCAHTHSGTAERMCALHPAPSPQSLRIHPGVLQLFFLLSHISINQFSILAFLFSDFSNFCFFSLLKWKI